MLRFGYMYTVRLPRTRGFTIPELLVVVAVIGILATIVVVSYSALQPASADRSVESDVSNVISELARYQKANQYYSTDGTGSAVTWYSGSTANPNVRVTPGAGNSIDVVANNTDYCVRAFNANSKYTNLAAAYTKGSTPTACAGLAVSQAAVSALYTFGSLTWTEQTGAPSGSWFEVDSSADGMKLVAVRPYQYVSTSDDGGVSWTNKTTSRNDISWTAVTTSADGSKLAATASIGGIYTSTDRGATWTERTGAGSRSWRAIDSSADGVKLVAVDNSGYVYVSSDSGATWTAITAAGSRNWSEVAVSPDGQRVVAAPGWGGSTGYIYTSSNGGSSFTQRTSAGLRYWYGLTISTDGSKIAAVARGGHVYTSMNGGATFTERNSAGSQNWQDLDGSSDGMRLIATSSSAGGYLYASLDGGVTWTQQTTAGQRGWYAVASSANGTRVYGLAYGERIWSGQYN